MIMAETIVAGIMTGIGAVLAIGGLAAVVPCAFINVTIDKIEGDDVAQSA